MSQSEDEENAIEPDEGLDADFDPVQADDDESDDENKPNLILPEHDQYEECQKGRKRKNVKEPVGSSKPTKSSFGNASAPLPHVIAAPNV
ncbi:hypothetical protein M422DRAFT_267146 [Sphaerobolus stellatus SS14]|uniref:Uncharacterized protein n=1 Tax=Sphaerobolus stellatus (strain SS14) TaxID=990650 RepID=A0A0C9UQ67_SPHS4|nr:hypothetical protein M422DRAFT_267146 [Sphaerobolus stellatus SS14]